MAPPLSAKLAAWIKDNEGKHFCKCGCGGPIMLKPFHTKPSSGVPRYIKGHIIRSSRPIADRFWEKVAKAGPDECWLWTACKKRRGYGAIGRGAGTGRAIAHRLSWELHNGPVPDGLCVCHNCPGGDNPSCVNPAHLFLGTNADNSADMIAKGRSNRGEKNPQAKANYGMVAELRRRWAAGGVTQRDLAAEFGLSRAMTCLILSGKRWNHAPPA
jgi:hypothetical protein